MKLVQPTIEEPSRLSAAGSSMTKADRGDNQAEKGCVPIWGSTTNS
jgi:hypothetical protein